MVLPHDPPDSDDYAGRGDPRPQRWELLPSYLRADCVDLTSHGYFYLDSKGDRLKRRAHVSRRSRIVGFVLNTPPSISQRLTLVHPIPRSGLLTA